MPERRVALLLRIRRVLKDRLADLAKREHRSLNRQIEFILERFLSDKANEELNEQQSRKGGQG
jgi:hypothetical protein